MVNLLFQNWKVGVIVAGKFRTAAVFRTAGSDINCGGSKNLAEAELKQNPENNILFHKTSKL